MPHQNKVKAPFPRFKFATRESGGCCVAGRYFQLVHAIDAVEPIRRICTTTALARDHLVAAERNVLGLNVRIEGVCAVGDIGHNE